MVTCVFCGCASEPLLEPISLIDPVAWQAVDADTDSFAAMRPADAHCEPDAYGPEDFGGEPSFEIWTGACNFLTVEQPSTAALAKGSTVELRLWHFDLQAPEPATAYLAVRIADALVWEHEIEIPADGGLIVGSWELLEDVEVGDLIVFHLQNHGANSYVCSSSAGRIEAV